MTAWQHTMNRIACDFRLWKALEQPGGSFFWRASLAMIGSFIWHFQGHFLRKFCYKSRSVWKNAENLLTVHRFVHLCAFFCMFSTFLGPTLFDLREWQLILKQSAFSTMPPTASYPMARTTAALLLVAVGALNPGQNGKKTQKYPPWN